MVRIPDASYVCHDCGHAFDSPQRGLEDDPCPSCGASEVGRDFGNVGVIFKGAGFHQNDYPSTPSEPPSITTEVGGSTKHDIHGEAHWKPTRKTLRRAVAKSGGNTDAASLDRAEDQLAKTERDKNLAMADLRERGRKMAAKQKETFDGES